MFGNLWKALQIGNEIKNPETWKNRGNAINAVAGLLAFLCTLLPSIGINVQMPASEQVVIAGGVVALVNIVLATITSKKIGISGGAQK